MNDGFASGKKSELTSRAQVVPDDVRRAFGDNERVLDAGEAPVEVPHEHLKAVFDARTIPSGRLLELREQVKCTEELRMQLADASELSEAMKHRVSVLARSVSEERAKLDALKRSALQDAGCDPEKKYVLNLAAGFFVSAGDET